MSNDQCRHTTQTPRQILNSMHNRVYIKAREMQIEHPPPVLTKQDFTRRYKAGEFGNAAPTWETLGGFIEAMWSDSLRFGKFHLRNRIPGGPTHYNLTKYEAIDLWQKAEDESQWYCSAMAPEDRKILQGELVLLDGNDGLDSSGLYLMFNRARLPMRDGMNAEYATPGYKDRMHLEGPKARLLLMHALCPNSLDWLEILLNRYPGHVVEFSTYEVEWGTLPGYNTVWWEIRKY